MFDTEMLAKARAEAVRLNGELRELHLEEQRLGLKRQRIEKARARVSDLIDLCELAQQLAKAPVAGPIVRLTPVDLAHPTGPQFAGLAVPAAGSVAEKRLVAAEKAASKPAPQAGQKHKPEDLPSVTTMVTRAFQAAAKQGQDELALRDVLALVRNKWWPDASRRTVSARIRKMCVAGQLEKGAGVYRLNGHG